MVAEPEGSASALQSRRIPPLVLLVVAVGCGILGADEPFVDFSVYEPLPRLVDLEVPESAAGDDIVYWELRRSFDPWSTEGDEVLLSGGPGTREDLDAELLARFDSSGTAGGFAESCQPGACPAYIAAIGAGGTVEIRDRADEVQSFLAPVESAAEAALVAFVFGYEWWPPIETGAVRHVDDAWWLVVTRIVAFCDPVRTDRFLLRIGRDGGITVIKQQEYSREDGVCI